MVPSATAIDALSPGHKNQNSMILSGWIEPVRRGFIIPDLFLVVAMPFSIICLPVFQICQETKAPRKSMTKSHSRSAIKALAINIVAQDPSLKNRAKVKLVHPL